MSTRPSPTHRHSDARASATSNPVTFLDAGLFVYSPILPAPPPEAEQGDDHDNCQYAVVRFEHGDYELPVFPHHQAEVNEQAVPQQGAEQYVERHAEGVHAGDARHNADEYPHGGQEPVENDDFVAIAIEPRFGAVQGLFIHEV